MMEAIVFKLKVGGSVKSAFDRICFYSVGDSITDKSKSYIYEIEYGLLKAPPENKLYQLGRRSAIVDELENGNKAGEVMVIADSVKSLLFECWDGEKWSRELLQDGFIADNDKGNAGIRRSYLGNRKGNIEQADIVDSNTI